MKTYENSSLSWQPTKNKNQTQGCSCFADEFSQGHDGLDGVIKIRNIYGEVEITSIKYVFVVCAVRIQNQMLVLLNS